MCWKKTVQTTRVPTVCSVTKAGVCNRQIIKITDNINSISIEPYLQFRLYTPCKFNFEFKNKLQRLVRTNKHLCIITVNNNIMIN